MCGSGETITLDKIMAIGLVRLRLNKSDLLSFTFRQFLIIYEEYLDMRKREEKWNAIMCATIANGYSRKYIKAEDFLPSLKEDNKSQTPEEQLQILSQFVH